MEVKLNKKIHTYLNDLNAMIVTYCSTKQTEDGNIDIKELKNYLNDNNTFQLTKTDFYKKNRSKNIVKDDERCLAIRANETQCTRRRKEGSCFCGTHIKGAPHGTIPTKKTNESPYKKIAIYNHEIDGINCFLDSDENIYKTEDIMNNNERPAIIGKYGTTITNDTTIYFRK